MANRVVGYGLTRCPTSAGQLGNTHRLPRYALFLWAAALGRISQQALGFKGAWTITSEGKKLSFEMTYDLASKDSVVTEFFGKELSVFYLDGENLLMTHYCNAGSHPRLKLRQGSGAGRYEFEMMDITNLKDVKEAAHVQPITYQVVAQGQLYLEILWMHGKETKSENYTLTKDQ
jgi:hypothetical protein